MKRSLVGALLGLAVATSALAQGHILVSNYVDPYNQIYFGSEAPVGQAGRAITSAAGLQFQVFFGYGNVSIGSVTNPGLTFGINDTFNYDGGHGPGGYFVNVDQLFPSWTPGSDITLMYKVITAGYFGTSALWTENVKVQPPANPPLSTTATPGLIVTVPEPSMFALAGLGAAALLIFRRRS